jgi:hypothetical protein
VYTPIALFLHPRPVGTVRWLAIFLWPLVGGTALWTYGVEIPLSEALSGTDVSNPRWSGFGPYVLIWSPALAQLPFVVVLWFATRSRQVALGAVSLALTTAIVKSALHAWDPTVLSQFAIAVTSCWHLLLALILFHWALRARFREQLGPHACSRCLYDRRASPDATCPECGALGKAT